MYYYLHYLQLEATSTSAHWSDAYGGERTFGEELGLDGCDNRASTKPIFAVATALQVIGAEYDLECEWLQDQIHYLDVESDSLSYLGLRRLVGATLHFFLLFPSSLHLNLFATLLHLLHFFDFQFHLYYWVFGGCSLTFIFWFWQVYLSLNAYIFWQCLSTCGSSGGGHVHRECCSCLGAWVRYYVWPLPRDLLEAVVLLYPYSSLLIFQA